MKILSVIEDQAVVKKIPQRRTSPQPPWLLPGQNLVPTPKRQSAAFIRRAPYRLFRILDSRRGLWPWALARDGVPREGKSSWGRPERSAAKSKGDEVGPPLPSLSKPRRSLPLTFPADYTTPQHPRPRQSSCPSTCCAKSALDTQGQNLLYSVPLEASSYHLTSP